MKIVLTGAKGMLGSDVDALARARHEVTATDKEELDITKADATRRFFAENEADVIINCAAYTDVDGCEADRDNAYLLNAVGPRNLAAAASEIGAALVHISTDYIFDGAKGSPYREDDAPNPISVYGATKLAGERFVQGLTGKHYIVRTQWLFGENGGNFVDTMLKLAKVKDSLSVVNDQFGSPTYARDLAAAIVALIQRPAYGVYHITNGGVVSWYDFAREIFRQAGVKATVTPCTTAEFPRPARRPAYGALENRRWKANGHPPLRPFGEALADYLKI